MLPVTRRQDAPSLSTLQSIESARNMYGDTFTTEAKRTRCIAACEELKLTNEQEWCLGQDRNAIGPDLPPVKSRLRSSSPSLVPKVQGQHELLNRPPRKRCRCQPLGNPRKYKHGVSSLDTSPEGCHRWENHPVGLSRGSLDRAVNWNRTDSKADVPREREKLTEFATPTAIGLAAAHPVAMGKEISIAEERFPQGRLYRADVKVSSFHEGDCGLTISMSETYPPVDSSLTTAAESGYDASINAPPGSNNARCGMRRKRRWRSVRIGIGPSSDPKIKKTAVKAPCSLYKRWFMSQNQVQRQMRLAMLEMRPEIARVLETLAAECSGRGRTRDFFKKVGIR